MVLCADVLNILCLVKLLRVLASSIAVYRVYMSINREKNNRVEIGEMERMR
jgi:hypothetical protein